MKLLAAAALLLIVWIEDAPAFVGALPEVATADLPSITAKTVASPNSKKADSSLVSQQLFAGGVCLSG
jgi:hypothetical protein